jgi:ribosomal protein S18 acetylase RimI-like enzyme
MNLVDVTHRLGDPELLEVLSDSVGFPTPKKLARVAEVYATTSSRNAFALMDGVEVVGVIGLEVLSPGRGRIIHIAVTPSRRQQGVGRMLIDRASRLGGLRELSAETDGDAVEFYRRCGFTIERLPDRQWNRVRFLCRASIPDIDEDGPSWTE